MYDELTEVDIQKMREELRYRQSVLRPQIIRDVQTARAFGDLSENYEYKAAKQEQRKCDSRIRYLKRMLDTAKVVSIDHEAGVVGLFDHVELRYPEDNETETVQIVTTLRQNAVGGFISKESPLGQALMGRKIGDTVTVDPGNGMTYPVEILSITPGQDNNDLPISRF